MTAGAPATNTQGDAQPQPGRRTRTSRYDPAILAGNYRSSGWQKDLEHMLKVYYCYNLQAPFDELEWIRVRELFFDRFVAKKAEALRIKEESPLDYMPFIAGEFYAVTGICLHELQDFTRWIKKNSYYHGLLAHRGQIEEIPHLIGEGFPKWPQLKPSESCWNSYSRAEGPVAGSSKPTTSPPAAPTQETPVEEPPMVEAPAPGPSHSSPPAAPTQETPAVEPPVAEAPVPDPSHSSPPAPMETGGAGDGQSWTDRAEASAEAEFWQVQPPKCPRSQSRRCGVGLMLPFPLQDSEGRLAAVMKLYDHTVEQRPPRDGIAGEAIRHLHSHMLPHDTRHLGNQVVCMIAEYHLMCSSRVTSTESPILPEAAKPLLPNLKSYIPHISFEGTQDVRVVDHAKALWVAVWLHRLDMSARGDEVALETLDASQHHLGHLLESFPVPATHGLSFREVMA